MDNFYSVCGQGELQGDKSAGSAGCYVFVSHVGKLIGEPCLARVFRKSPGQSESSESESCQSEERIAFNNIVDRLTGSLPMKSPIPLALGTSVCFAAPLTVQW